VSGRTAHVAHAARAVLARERPTVEHVARPKHLARPVAVPHATGADVTHMRKHAAKWLRAHGLAHAHLARAKAPAERAHEHAEIVHVRYRKSLLRHAPHPAKAVVISHARKRILGEQG
jgi:hypothetical protein